MLNDVNKPHRRLIRIACVIMLAIIILLWATSCSTTKKTVDKTSVKSDSSASKKLSVDSSTHATLSVTTKKKEASATATENTFEPQQIDSGVGIIFRNGTAGDFTEILPAPFIRKIFLPKSTITEVKNFSHTEQRTQANETKVKKETAEAVEVKHELQQMHKDVKRSPWFFSLYLIAGLLTFCIAAYHFKVSPFAYLRRRNGDSPDE